MEEHEILTRHPLPIARGYRRFRNAEEVRERHDAAYYLYEIYLKYAASIAMARYLAGEERDHRVNAVLKGLVRPSLGEWVRFLRECLRFLSVRSEVEPGIAAMAALLETKESRWGEVVRLSNGIRGLRTGEGSARDKVSLGMLLDEIVGYRNRVLGHGAPLSGKHYQEFGDLLGRAYPELLAQSPFLTVRRLVSFGRPQVIEGVRVECGIVVFRGLQPVRSPEPLRLPYGSPAPRDGVLHLLDEDGKFMPLDPFLISHDEDVYFLNEAEGAPEYLSYATGERHRPSVAGESQQNLFERILGYRVDSSRLSRIGDDCAAAPPASAGEPAVEGERIFGDYRIKREIGRGAMGAVFEAVQTSLGRRVALKVLPGTFALDPKRVERFLREARATARIHHPSIVPVYEVGEVEGTHFYAMEFVDGSSLDRELDQAREAARRQGGRKGGSSISDPGAIALCVERMAALAEGLHEAHRNGLVHRDVKPSNILIDAGGRYVLVDFGLVHEEEAKTLTRTGEMVGTLRYMSPEQVSRSEVDPRSDVFSLGVTLYETLTLVNPFDRKTDHEVQRAILFEDAVPPRRRNPRLNRDLETIVLRALEKNPERRYASASDLAADLRRLLRYEPIKARPRSFAEKVARSAWRNKGRVAAVAILLLLAASSGLLLKSQYQADRSLRLDRYKGAVLAAVMKMEIGRPASKWPIPNPQAAPNSPVAPPSAESIIQDPVEDSVAELETAEGISPERPEAYYYRAQGLHTLGKDREALEELRRATERDPGFAPAAVLRDVIVGEGGDRGDAARASTEGASRTPRTPWQEAWIKAYTAGLKRRPKEAIEAYTYLIENEDAGEKAFLGSQAKIRLGRGIARLNDGDYPGALEDFASAETMWPDAIEPVLLIARVYYYMEKPELGDARLEASFRKARYPDDFAFRVTELFHDLEECEKGLAWAERIREADRREIRRADFLGHVGRVEEAIGIAGKAIEKDEKDAEAHFIHGWLLDVAGRYEEAVSSLKRAISLDPKLDKAYYQLGSTLQRLGRYEQTEAAWRKYVELEPNSPMAYYYLGDLLSKLKKYDEAATAFRKAIELNPTSTAVYAYQSMGEALHAAGRIDEAIAALREAARLGPKFSFPLLHLSNILRSQGKLDEALLACLSGMERLTRPDTVNTFKSLLKEVLGGWKKEAPGADRARAVLAAAKEAVLLSGSKDVELLEMVAEVHAFNGEHKEAVLVLEEATSSAGGAPKGLLEKLEETRRKVLPDLVSYPSIDWVLAKLAPGSKEEREANDRFLSCPETPGRKGLIAYFEGMLLLRAGKHEAAVEKFLELVSLDGSHPEPILRLAECIWARGDARIAGLFHPARKGDDGKLPAQEELLVPLRWVAEELGLRKSVPPLPILGETADDRRNFIRWSIEQLTARKIAKIPDEVLRAAGPSSRSDLLYSFALEAKFPGIWQELEAGVSSKQFLETPMVGSQRKDTWKDVPEGGGILTGFKLTFGMWRDAKIIRSLQPIFMTARGRVEGKVYGGGNERPLVLEARPGYGVGAMVGDGEDRANGFKVRFMRIQGASLDPGDSYESAWVGGELEGFRKELDGNGMPAVGIAITFGADVDSLGLVFLKGAALDYASVDGAIEAPHEFLDEGARWSAFLDGGEPPEGWTGPGFDDGSWRDVEPSLLRSSSGSPWVRRWRMPGSLTFVRCAFQAAEGLELKKLVLAVGADGAFQAFVNGTEVARVRIEDPAIWFPIERTIIGNEPVDSHASLLRLEIPIDPKLLRSGKNALAIRSFLPPEKMEALGVTLDLRGEPMAGSPFDGERHSRFRELLRRKGSGDLLAYLEGRLLQRAGKHSEAAGKFERILGLGTSRPEPFLRLAECLRAAGEAVRAEGVLRKAIDGDLSDSQPLWALRGGILLNELKGKAGDLLSSTGVWTDDKDLRSGPILFLKEFAEKGAARIRCGGVGYRSASGAFYGPDCFYLGGSGSDFDVDLSHIPDGALYKTERWFEGTASPETGYRIPLPPDDYLVTLRFAEVYFDENPGNRIFDVHLEGEKGLEDFEPCPIRLGVPEPRKFLVPVRDGFLDIAFVSKVTNAKITAIEIERAMGKKPEGPGKLNPVFQEATRDYILGLRLLFLGENLAQRGRTREAETAYERSLAILEGLETRFPEVPQFRKDAQRREITRGLKLLRDLPGSSPPETPRNLSPEEGVLVPTFPVVLRAGPFRHDNPQVSHLSTRWQVRRDGAESSLVLDLESGKDLEELKLPMDRLLPRSTYRFRVSFRGSNRRSTPFSAESTFRTGDFKVEFVRFDLSAVFNRDVIANPGDGENDSLHHGGALFLEDGFDGTAASNPAAKGLPHDRVVGPHLLGDYGGLNAFQARSGDKGRRSLEVPPGKYSSIRFLVAGGGGWSEMPVTLEFSDGKSREAILACDDWFADLPENPDGAPDPDGTPHPGALPVLNGLDRFGAAGLEAVKDPALFEVILDSDPGKDLARIVFETERAIYGDPSARFNLFAATGVRVEAK